MVLALALVAAGCGSSSSSDSTSAALTKAEYVKQGNAICKKANAKIESAAKEDLGPNPSKAQVTSFVNDTLGPALDEELSGLHGLTPPSGDEKTVSAMLDEADQALAKVKADPSTITSGNPFTKANKDAKAYGLTVCAG